MDKTDPPTSFGIFKPVGHTVLAFASHTTLQAAVVALLSDGFVADALMRYTAAEMVAQVEKDLESVSPLAALGSELAFVQAQGKLAEAGCGFLVVHAPDDEQAERVMVVARRLHARAAYRYGTFFIEELESDTVP